MLLKVSALWGVRWIPVIQCAWCRAIRIGSHYIHLPWLGLISGDWTPRLFGWPLAKVSVTHSVCHDCARGVNARAKARRARQRRSTGAGESLLRQRLSVRVDRSARRVPMSAVPVGNDAEGYPEFLVQDGPSRRYNAAKATSTTEEGVLLPPFGP